ncbi:MAG: hypothetical protein U5K70_08485 [Halodesulfurarchaeum sp.]|nr:hypothetical protein [Halodesulfurarchaeum sp.]
MSRSTEESSSDPGGRPAENGLEHGSGDFAPAKLEASLRHEFLLQAGLLNGGVLAVGAGLVLLAFTAKLAGGILLTGMGALLLVLAVWRYRREAPSN